MSISIRSVVTIPALLMRVHTERVALDLVLSRAPRNWSAWTVEVYDASGRDVVSKPFADVLAIRQARQG